MREIDFFGVGAPKCGTTWLASCLASHPDVFIPKKEFKYFDRQYKENLSGFIEAFQNAGANQIIGEFTPMYMFSFEAMSRIKKHYPNTKLLILLRDPIERAISQYTFYVYNLKRENKLSFQDALNDIQRDSYIRKGLYYESLQNVLSLFPKENVYIDVYDNIVSQPDELLKRVFRFLGLNENHVPEFLNSKIHFSKKSTEIPSKALLTLNKCLKNDNYFSFVPRIFVRFLRRVVIKFPKLFQSSNSGRERLSIEDTAKSYLYKTFFEEDIKGVEKLTGLDLKSWKRY